MKRLIILALAISTVGALGQTIPTTPNFGLQLIPDGYPAWGVPYRATMNTIDSLVAPLASPHFTGTFTLPTSLNGCLYATSGVVSATGSACGAGGGGSVSSVFGRTGAVAPAANDYSFSQISGTLNLATQVTGTLGAGNVATLNQNTTGNAATATLATSALAAPYSGLTGSVPTWNQNTTGNAATATALASTPTLCSTGQAPTGVTANGNATGCAAISGSSGISGGTAGYVPLFGSATTITGPSHMDDGVTTAATITSSEPIAVNVSGAPHQVSFTYNSVALVPGSSTTVVYGVNASGQAIASEAGGAASRLCTAANGVCSSGSVTFPWSCQPGLGDGLNVITAGTYLQTSCYNDTGQTVTLTGLRCYADAGTPTMNVTNGAGTGLLTGAVTCTTAFAAGTQSGTTTIASGDYLEFTFVASGTAKQATFVATGTHP